MNQIVRRHYAVCCLLLLGGKLLIVAKSWTTPQITPGLAGISSFSRRQMNSKRKFPPEKHTANSSHTSQYYSPSTGIKCTNVPKLICALRKVRLLRDSHFSAEHKRANSLWRERKPLRFGQLYKLFLLVFSSSFLQFSPSRRVMLRHTAAISRAKR